MSISQRNNRALNRVLRETLRARPHPEAEPQEEAKAEAPAYTLCADIPESYNDSYVRAIPKDPQNTVVYWELPKGHADGSLLADKGTAHVKNDEAVRIGEQLDKSRRRRYDSGQERPGNDYQCIDAADQGINTDNGNQYGKYDCGKERPRNDYPYIGTDTGNQYGHGGVDQCSHDNGNQYGRNMDIRYDWNDNFQQQHYHQESYHQIGWDNGDHYNNYENCRRHYYDAIYQRNWNDGDQYRRDDAYKYTERYLDGINQSAIDQYRANPFNWNDGGEYRINSDQYRIDIDKRGGNGDQCGVDFDQYRSDNDRCGCLSGASFSEMLAALIARCNRYIADYRQSESSGARLAVAMSSGLLQGQGDSAPPARAMSSGLFSGVGEGRQK